jgi:hypothetical protein
MKYPCQFIADQSSALPLRQAAQQAASPASPRLFAEQGENEPLDTGNKPSEGMKGQHVA